eukprot:Gb_02359 [translate_table: standard]
MSACVLHYIVAAEAGRSDQRQILKLASMTVGRFLTRCSVAFDDRIIMENVGKLSKGLGDNKPGITPTESLGEEVQSVILKAITLIWNCWVGFYCTVTTFASASLRPSAGASGEYDGLMVILAYCQRRMSALFPRSAGDIVLYPLYLCHFSSISGMF